MDIPEGNIKSAKLSPELALALIGFAPLLLFLLYTYIPIGIDWRDTYRPAALAMARGESPYSVDIYYAAPWGAALLIPFALLPYGLGRFLLFLVSIASFAAVPIALQRPETGIRVSPPVFVLFMTSAAVVGCLNNGNIEFLPLLAVICPPWLGLILLAIKPQVGVGLAIFWGIQIWRHKGPGAALRAFLPVSLMLSASFIIYGVWPLRFSQTLAWSVDNTALFPWGFPLGVVLLYVAIEAGWKSTALAASPLLSPYVLQFTWVSLLVELLDRPRLFFFAWVALWIPVIIRILE